MNNKETKPATVVVNDDTTQLGILSGLLAKAGVEARAFESAEAALTAMDQADPPDLVVTDLYMPGIDGWRFCRLLRSPVDGKAFTAQIKALMTGKEASRLPRALIVEDGKTLAGLLKKTFAANGYRVDAERLKDSVELHRTSTEPIFEIYRVRSADGTWLWWEDRGTPILDEGGNPMTLNTVCSLTASRLGSAKRRT